MTLAESWFSLESYDHWIIEVSFFPDFFSDFFEGIFCLF